MEQIQNQELKQERKINKKGYVLIYKPDYKYSKTKDGWIKEHTSVIEDFLKRRLINPECIHHIDFDKENNKIENLMLFNNHKEHSSFHNKIKRWSYTRPILRQIKNRWEGVR